MQNIIKNLIKFQNQIRILHWQTKKYSEHQAFGQAYQDLDKLIDQLVEVYQGKRGTLEFSLPFEIELVNADEISIMDVLEDVTSYLSSEVDKQCNKETDTDCLTIRDEILIQVNKLKYLLTLQ